MSRTYQAHDTRTVINSTNSNERGFSKSSNRGSGIARMLNGPPGWPLAPSSASEGSLARGTPRRFLAKSSPVTSGDSYSMPVWTGRGKRHLAGNDFPRRTASTVRMRERDSSLRSLGALVGAKIPACRQSGDCRRTAWKATGTFERPMISR
jgi:hypothetical protein